MSRESVRLCRSVEIAYETTTHIKKTTLYDSPSDSAPKAMPKFSVRTRPCENLGRIFVRPSQLVPPGALERHPPAHVGTERRRRRGRRRPRKRLCIRWLSSSHRILQHKADEREIFYAERRGEARQRTGPVLERVRPLCCGIGRRIDASRSSRHYACRRTGLRRSEKSGLQAVWGRGVGMRWACALHFLAQ